MQRGAGASQGTGSAIPWQGLKNPHGSVIEFLQMFALVTC